MSSLIEVIPVEEENKKTLADAYNILKDIRDDMYYEDLEDTDEYHYVDYGVAALYRCLDCFDIIPEEYE